jgi:hypothetical protein
MKKLFALALVPAAVFFNCGTSSPTSSANNNNNNNTVYQSNASGTISGSITGTITGAQIWVVKSNNTTTQPVAELVLSATFSTGASSNQVSITVPSGTTAASLASSIGFTQTPSTGSYSNTSTTSCGGVVFTATTASTTDEFLVANSRACDGTTGDSTGGTYNLALSSVSLINTISNGTASVSYYKVGGTLDATIPGSLITTAPPITSTNGSVTVHLSF